jgi:hypothetical protein
MNHSLSQQQIINGFIACLTFIVLQGIMALAIGGVLVAEDKGPLVGGYQKIAISEEGVKEAAIYAIQKQKAAMKAAGKSDAISLVKIVEAERQVVAGFNYHLQMKVKTDKATTVVSIVVYDAFDGKKELTSWEEVAE